MDLFSYLYLSPRFFLKKKRWGYCNRLRPSVTLSHPKPLYGIQPNFMCVCVCVAHMNGVCNGTFFVARPLGRGQKVKYYKISLNFNN